MARRAPEALSGRACGEVCSANSDVSFGAVSSAAAAGAVEADAVEAAEPTTDPSQTSRRRQLQQTREPRLRGCPQESHVMPEV
jgi:hypothetical protein